MLQQIRNKSKQWSLSRSVKITYAEWYFGGERVSVIDYRQAVVTVPAVHLDTPTSAQQHLTHHTTILDPRCCFNVCSQVSLIYRTEPKTKKWKKEKLKIKKTDKSEVSGKVRGIRGVSPALVNMHRYSYPQA